MSVEVDSGVRRELGIGIQPRYRPGMTGLGYIAEGLLWKDVNGQVHAIVPGEALGAGKSVVDWDWMPDGKRVVFTV